MKQVLFFLFVLVAVIFFGCRQKPNDTRYYYALDSLLKDQARHLAGSKAVLTKKAFINGKEETQSFVPADTLAWQTELDVFAQLNDINKPTNMGKYNTTHGLKDRYSNLLIYTMEATDTLPVSYLNVYYLDTLSNIRKIEGLYREKGFLLSSSRHLIMEFQNVHNKIVLTSYSMQGGQKMLLSDSVQFSVHGTITLP